jgi:hypothetical protein
MLDGNHVMQTTTIDGQVISLVVGKLSEFDTYNMLIIKGDNVSGALDTIWNEIVSSARKGVQSFVDYVAGILSRFNTALSAYFGHTVPAEDFDSQIEAWFSGLRFNGSQLK